MKKIVTLAAAIIITALPVVSQLPSDEFKNGQVVFNSAYQNETIKWSKTSHDFGNIPMGPAAEVTFKFTNNTGAPLVIKTANPSCGCTTPTYTKTPVMPGETGDVKASYGTEGRPGYFQKTVTVTFDNGASQVLTIQGTVASEAKPAQKDELK